MKIPKVLNSFRAQLLLLLALLLGLTLGVQYYVNLRSVEDNAHLIIDQEQAIMAGVALGVNSINSRKYLDQIRSELREPIFDERTGRVKNVLVIDNNGLVQDSLVPAYQPRENEDKTIQYVHIQEVPLPPRSPAVELTEINSNLPLWLQNSPSPKSGEPGAFYFPVETTKGRWYIL